MRIIGGTLKGRTLYGFKGDAVRPTSDSARESLFNILGEINGLDFLDLFSGTGAIGIEASSRGAIAHFNDSDKTSVELTSANLKLCGLKAEVTRGDALSFISTSRKKFDVIFCDPPYKSPVIRETLNSVSTILKDGGTVVLENDKPFTGVADGLILYDVRRYGKAVFSFFRKKHDGAAVYAGSFDPVTIGHERSVNKTINAFEKVFIVIGENPDKKAKFCEDDRQKLLSAVFSGKKAEIIKFSDFKSEDDYANFLLKNNAVYYVRGIRDEKDFAYEKKAERRNSVIYPFMTTAYIFCEEEDKKYSSSLVKTYIEKGKDASLLLPESAREIFEEIVKKTAEKK